MLHQSVLWLGMLGRVWLLKVHGGVVVVVGVVVVGMLWFSRESVRGWGLCLGVGGGIQRSRWFTLRPVPRRAH
jgi:hypothetical protein